MDWVPGVRSCTTFCSAFKPNHRTLYIPFDIYLQGATPKDLAVQFQKQGCVNFLNSVERETDPGATQDTDTDGYSLSDLDFEEDSEEELAGSSLPGVGSPERRGRRALQEEAEQRKEMELRK